MTVTRRAPLELAQRWGLNDWGQSMPGTQGGKNAAQERHSATSGLVEMVPFDLDDFPAGVRAEIGTPEADGTSIDRSDKTFDMVKVGLENGLNLGQIQWFVRQRADVRQRLDDEGHTEDVERIYNKLVQAREAERRRQRQDDEFFLLATGSTPTNQRPNATPPDTFDSEVEKALRTIRVRERARRLFDAENQPHLDLPPIRELGGFLAEPPTETRWVIEGLAPAEGNVMLAAQYKAGKSTLTSNCVRSLVDGDLFLGKFTVPGVCQRVVLIDNELGQNTLRDWLGDQKIRNTNAVSVVSLRGRVSTFNILDDRVRAAWAAQLAEIGCDYLVLDCLRPILDALGLDENRDTGLFLVAFDALLLEAGIKASLLVQHMGHGNERARGDSRQQDWPDAMWRIVREDPNDPRSPRYFSAFGRDVDVREGRLSFDEPSRRLTYVDGNRHDAKTGEALPAVLRELATHAKSGGPGLSGRAVEDAVDDHPRAAVRAALKLAEARGLVVVERGEKRSRLHRIAKPCGACGMPLLGGQIDRHNSCSVGGSL